MIASDFVTRSCPYCGEAITFVIDASAGEQDYVEDCQVCCRPIVLSVTFDTGGLPEVALRREHD
jgi:hypothetical protein